MTLPPPAGAALVSERSASSRVELRLGRRPVGEDVLLPGEHDGDVGIGEPFCRTTVTVSPWFTQSTGPGYWKGLPASEKPHMYIVLLSGRLM